MKNVALFLFLGILFSSYTTLHFSKKQVNNLKMFNS